MEDFESLEVIEEDKKEKFSFNFSEYKFAFYTGLFYVFGLFAGSYFYKLAGGEKLSSILEINDDTFLNLFITNFCLYFSIFLITTFLGFCLIGKPVIYIIPVFIGIGVGMRLAYYFINYQTKGVGYTLIMMLPYIALFITIISYTIDTGTMLSSNLLRLTKGEGQEKLELTPYLKRYLIYSLIIIFITLADCAMTKLLFSVVTI